MGYIILLWHSLSLPYNYFVRDFMIVFLTYKNEEDPIKNEDARVLTRLYNNLFQMLKAVNSAVSGGIRPKFKLI